MAGSEVPAIDGPAGQGRNQGAAGGAVVVVRSDRRGTRQYSCENCLLGGTARTVGCRFRAPPEPSGDRDMILFADSGSGGIAYEQ